MEKMKKICLCAAAVAGTAGIAGISAKAVEGVRKNWFLRGFEAGQFIGNLTAAENFAQEKTVIQQKYDKLLKLLAELVILLLDHGLFLSKVLRSGQAADELSCIKTTEKPLLAYTIDRLCGESCNSGGT